MPPGQTSRALALATLIAIAIAGAGAAQADDTLDPACAATVAKTWALLADTPGYRQSVDMPKHKMKVEQVAIGDRLWTSTDGKTWQSLSFGPGGRKAMTLKMVGGAKVLGCQERGGETLDGVAMRVFDYRSEPLPGAGPGPIDQKLWIGATDGLPYRLTSPDTSISVAYDRLEPPTK